MYMHLLQCGHMKVLHVIRSRLFQAQELQNLQASVRQAQCAEGCRTASMRSREVVAAMRFEIFLAARSVYGCCDRLSLLSHIRNDM